MTAASSPTAAGGGLAGVGGLILAACSPARRSLCRPRTSAPRSPPVASAGERRRQSVSAAEPTTTNTLPPPPPPSGPAPSTAGSLSARSLPVPAGWQTAVLDGGDEEGLQGNGTWVHARDPATPPKT